MPEADESNICELRDVTGDADSPGTVCSKAALILVRRASLRAAAASPAKAYGTGRAQSFSAADANAMGCRLGLGVYRNASEMQTQSLL